MKTIEEERKTYHVVTWPGVNIIDVYRATLALRQLRSDVLVRPIRFTNLEPTQYLVELTTSDEMVVTGFGRLVEVARGLRQCPPEDLPQEVLRDPYMRDIVFMGYLQEEAREILQPQPPQRDVAARSA